jgi:hypothetical protein
MRVYETRGVQCCMWVATQHTDKIRHFCDGGATPQLRPQQPGAPHSGFGTYLEMQAVALTSLQHRTA